MKARFVTGIMMLLMLSVSNACAETETFPFVGTINADKVNIRAGQSKNFEDLGELRKGDKVVVVQKSYSWYQIKLPQHATCYVYRKLVHFLSDQIGEINGSRVNVRARASTESAPLGQLNKLTKVKIVETLDDWYRIEPVEGLHGWVLDEFVDFTSHKVPPPVVVQLPTRNIYERKREEEEKLKAEEEARKAQEQALKVKIRGTVVGIKAQSTDQNVRHEITADDGKIYYLKGYRSLLDGFLNHRVQIEGVIQADSKFSQPVLLVTRVVLVL